MSIRDDLIIKYFTLCTNISMSEIAIFEQDLKSSINPKDLKLKLAKEIVAMYYGEINAKAAEENFENTFSKGGVPEDIIEVSVAKGVSLSDILMINQIVISKSEFRRLVSEGAVTNVDTGEKILDTEFKVSNGVYKVGKRRFIKIKVI